MKKNKSEDAAFRRTKLCACKSAANVSLSHRIFTSESVNIGHPDKTCDVIADAILDEALKQDKFAQMAVECAIKDDKLFVYGEMITNAKIDIDAISKQILKDIGYECEFQIIKQISCQSPEINNAVVKEELCANDQGIMYGYACSDTPQFMPLPIMLAHKLMQNYEVFRKTYTGYFADAKSQVSVLYNESNKPKNICTVVVSVSHDKTKTLNQIEKEIKEYVVLPVLKEYKNYDAGDTKILINTGGSFTVWGSFGDSGCVGRKIIVDTYGGVGRVGGGCFSSKNATKVDRSGAYYARYVAKNIVAHGYADKCEIQVAYAIGQAKPVGVYIETFGTNKKPITEIENFVSSKFDFRVANIIKELKLLCPIYKQTACYGHFGRDEFSWEKIKN